jgi:hypothetical protein
MGSGAKHTPAMIGRKAPVFGDYYLTSEAMSW